MTNSTLICANCETEVAASARYCFTCGNQVGRPSTEEDWIHLEKFFNYALDMCCIAGVDGYFKRVNPAFERMLGYTEAELLEKPFVDLIHPDDRGETMAEVGKLATGLPTLSFENRYRCKDGSYKDLQWTSFPEPNTGLVYAVARDITERRARSDHTDRLTGLATRRAFDGQFQEEWNRAGRLRVPLAIALVDVDFFRPYNEIYGHSAGDECLRQLAKVMTDHLRRSGDQVARYDGGEFALIMAGGLNTKTAAMLLNRIRTTVEGLQIPNAGADPYGQLTVSGGTASVIPSRDQAPHDLLNAADAALYQAKRDGRNMVTEFSAN